MFLFSVLEGAKPTGLHSMQFRNFAMVLSDSQLELLALTIDIDETSTEALATYFRNEIPRTMNAFMGGWMREPLGWNEALTIQPCAWNMLLRRRCVRRAGKFPFEQLFGYSYFHMMSRCFRPGKMYSCGTAK